MDTRNKLYEYLKSTQGFGSKLIDKAFQTVDRRDFVPPDLIEVAYQDTALPIGFGATISQPTTVLFMLNCLDPQEGDKVLDLGSGSGWTTALLGSIVGKAGFVFAVELMPELVEQSQINLKKYNYPNVKVVQAGEKLGLRKQAPFERILVSAAAKEMPSELAGQIKIGGRMVIPVKNSVWQIDRISEDKTLDTEFGGFAFVPLRQ